jgi:hypothetical protein
MWWFCSSSCMIWSSLRAKSNGASARVVSSSGGGYGVRVLARISGVGSDQCSYWWYMFTISSQPSHYRCTYYCCPCLLSGTATCVLLLNKPALCMYNAFFDLVSLWSWFECGPPQAHERLGIAGHKSRWTLKMSIIANVLRTTSVKGNGSQYENPQTNKKAFWMYSSLSSYKIIKWYSLNLGFGVSPRWEPRCVPVVNYIDCLLWIFPDSATSSIQLI